MNKLIKILLVALVGLFLVFGGFYWFVLQAVDFDDGAIENEYIIPFPQLNESIYVKARAWGLGGNHSEILLSNKPIKNRHREYSDSDQYIYKNSSAIFYEQIGVDTLRLYVDYKSKIPKDLESQVVIIQRAFKNSREIRDFTDNYKSYGLSKITVYEE